MTLDPATLSAYSTAATAFATIVLVIVTALLVIATRQLTDVTKKMWLAQDEPNLRFYIQYLEQIDKRIPVLYIRNIGKGTARDIRFNVAVINQNPPPQEIRELAPFEEKQIMGLPATHGEIHIREINYTDIHGMLKNPPDVNLPYQAVPKLNSNCTNQYNLSQL